VYDRTSFWAATGIPREGDRPSDVSDAEARVVETKADVAGAWARGGVGEETADQVGEDCSCESRDATEVPVGTVSLLVDEEPVEGLGSFAA
jgi:hypothetical protein